MALALATLFAVGASRALFTGCGRLASGLEMLLVGAWQRLWLTVRRPRGRAHRLMDGAAPRFTGGHTQFLSNRPYVAAANAL